MPSPAAAAAAAATAAEAAAAAAAGARNRPAAFADLDDSDEETAEEAFDDEEVDDDNGKHEQQKAPAAEGSNEDSALSTSSANTNNSSGNPTVAASSPIPNLNGAAPAVAVRAMDDDGYATPQRKRQKTEATGTAGSAAVVARRPLAALEDSRRLFQRLWTDEDEIVILQGFLDFTSRRAGAAHHHQDTGPFYDQIRARLQLDFNKSQLVEKLRRLKKKYRTLTARMSSGKDFAFKSPHDQATFEISRQIWGTTTLCSRSAARDDDDDVDLTPHQIGDISDRRRRRRRGRKRSVAEVAATAAAEALVLAAEAPVEVKVGESRMPGGIAPVLPSVIQETVRSSFSPMFKELVWCAVGAPRGAGGGGLDLEGLRLSLLPLGVGSQSHQVKLQSGAAAVEDEKWRKQQILELEVFSKRMELLQEQIKLLLRELRSAG